MNFIDISLGVLLIWGAIRGLMKGFLMEVASLIALIAGIYGAIHFSHFIINLLTDYVSWNEQYITWAGYALTFILIVLVITIVGKLLTKLVKLIALNLFNRILGGIFGLVKTVFLLSVLLMFINSLNTTQFIETETFDNSRLYTIVQPIAPLLLPQILEEGRKIDAEIQDGVLKEI